MCIHPNPLENAIDFLLDFQFVMLYGLSDFLNQILLYLEIDNISGTEFFKIAFVFLDTMSSLFNESK